MMQRWRAALVTPWPSGFLGWIAAKWERLNIASQVQCLLVGVTRMGVCECVPPSDAHPGPEWL